MGIWARLDSRLQPPSDIFSRRNFLTLYACVQLATGRCGRLQRGAVLTSPKSGSVKWPGPLDKREELAHSDTIVIFNFRRPSAGGGQVMDADEHHVLDAFKVLVECGIDFTRFQ